jgi:tetratricopeptide (TPR) repeat protein
MSKKNAPRRKSNATPGSVAPDAAKTPASGRPSLFDHIERGLDWLTIRRIIGLAFGVALVFFLLSQLVNRGFMNELRLDYARERGDWPGMIKRLERVVERNPLHVPSIVELAGCHIKINESEKALKLLELGPEQNAKASAGDKGRIHGLRSEALWRLGKKSEALKESEEALKILPQNPEANAVAARYWLDLGEPLKATPHVRALAELKIHEDIRSDYAQMVQSKYLEIPEEAVQDVPESI